MKPMGALGCAPNDIQCSLLLLDKAGTFILDGLNLYHELVNWLFCLSLQCPKECPCSALHATAL